MTDKAAAKQTPPETPASGVMSIDQAIGTAYAHWNAGQVSQAEHLCQKVLQMWPGNADALHLMGLMAHNWNNLDLAIDYLRKACQSPRAPALYFSNLAEMHRQKGQLSEGEVVGRQAVALDPMLSGGWNNLGIILQEQGNFEEALLCLQRVISLKPDYAEAHNNLGNTFKKLGRLAEARVAYMRALKIMPNYAQGYSNLSNLLKDFGDFDGAAEAAKKAIELSPRNADAYINAAANETSRLRHEEALRWLNALLSFAPDHPLGLSAKAGTLQKLDLNDEAVQFAQRAVTVAPQNGDAYNALGQALQAVCRMEEALAAYDKAAALPSLVKEQGLLNRGTLLMEINRADEAREAFAKAREINPLSVSAYFNVADLKTYKADDTDIPRMEEMLANIVQSHADRMALHFALGKAYLDIGNPEKAFAHFNDGNAMKRAQISYDPANTAAWLKNIAEAYPASRFEKPLASPGSDLPVFVIGLPRSGTTLVEQILASHPAIHGAGELPVMQKLVGGLRKADGQAFSYPQEVANFGERDLEVIAANYIARVQKLANGKQRVVDKMPANFIYAGLIAQAMPHARIVHVRRNAVDTCLSCYTKLFSAEQNFTYNLSDLGQFYNAYAELMDHWRKVLPADRFIEVDYEAVVGDVEAEAKRLIAFCGLSWDEACLKFNENKRPVRTASLNQVRQPIYTRSVGRWKKYEAQLQPLIQALGTHAS